MRKLLSLLLFVMTSLVMPNTAWADDEVTVNHRDCPYDFEFTITNE